ncbi:AAA family ATPase [Sutcliffiella horikoshii]|uniref:AAA family ATPase n=1 Tax=Sutcliffiella horikoshii TaxID=79883 RepID=UPI003CEEB826
MRKRIVDPFTPRRPVNDPEKFCGRPAQIEEVVDTLFQTANDNPTHTIITGDRGIGKSSLLLQTKYIAEGKNSLIEKNSIDIGGVDSFSFVTSWHDADHEQTANDVAKGLLEDLSSSIAKVFKKVDIHLDLAGLLQISRKQDDVEKTISQTVNEFIAQIQKAATKAKNENKSGILLCIDEIDRLDENSGIASFIKLSTEKMARERIDNVTFICAGITGSIQKMKDDHASILRTFKEIPIHRLSDDETGEIIREGFQSVKIEYDHSIIKRTFEMSAGFPEPVHLIGSALISTYDGSEIGNDNLDIAIKNIVGHKRKNEFNDLLIKAGSGKYQLILEAMASNKDKYVSNKFISEKLGLPPNEYSTNISNLCDRNIITKVDRGIYEFTDPLLKEYILNFGIIRVDSE